MKVSIRLKLFLSYAGILFATLVLVGWNVRMSLSSNFNEFSEKFMGPHERPEPFERGGEILFEAMESSLIYTTIIAGVIAILVSLLVSFLFTRPITEVIEATKAIARGEYNRRIRNHSNDELGELTQSVNAMADCLQENQRLQQDLITNVAHELATPLTSIRGYLEAMNDGLIKGKKRDDTLELMSEEAHRLSDMLTEVRELAQIQHPNFAIHKRKVNLDALIQKVMLQMEPQLKAKTLTLDYVNKSKEHHLQLDRDRIIQVLQNLLTNAIKYSPKKSVITIKFEDKKLIINDKGTGIPKADLPHLFDRFYRADRSRSRKTGGLGIGLAIVKEVMEAHDGHISVKSKVGKGTSFTCHFH